MMSVQIGRRKLLVNDLLEISRITRGVITLRKSRVDLAGVVRAAARTLASSIRGRKQDLVLAVEDGIVVNGDETRIEQVISNLLSNASNFSVEGGRSSNPSCRETRGAEASGSAWPS
jgi:two-component system CheB/CheR fusion protein